MYAVVLAYNHWYIFQKKRNPETKEWEGGTTTCLAPTIFKLNPDLDPFEGDLLWTRVILPIERELDTLTEQVHEALEDNPEPEPPRPESAQDSDTSISEPPKRMSVVTITLT